MLQVRLTAPPVDGLANAALIAFLASALNLRKADITLTGGRTSRLKRLEISGDASAILQKLEAMVRGAT